MVPKCTTDFPEGVVREGAEELTLQRGAEGTSRTFIDSTNVGGNRWGLGTLSARPSSQASKVRGGETWCFWCVETGSAVNINQPHTSRKAKTLWKVREAKAKGGQQHDQESRVAARQLWEKHLQGLAMALDEAPRRTVVVGDRTDSSTTGGSRSRVCGSFGALRAPSLFLR